MGPSRIRILEGVSHSTPRELHRNRGLETLQSVVHFARRLRFELCWLVGWLAGCGDADLRVNRGHEHLDLHVFQGSQDVPRAGWLAGGLAAGTPIYV